MERGRKKKRMHFSRLAALPLAADVDASWYLRHMRRHILENEGDCSQSVVILNLFSVLAVCFKLK